MTNKTALAVIALLLGALIVVFVMWQRDQESQDLRLDVDVGIELIDGVAPRLS